MAPTILVAGATGNTGRATVETLSKLVTSSKTLAGYDILALTRSLQSPAAQQLTKLPHVRVLELNWVDITASFLRSNNITRAFIASHIGPSQFAEESTFHLALLRAGVKYVVRISTTAPNVRPDYDAYYARNHWAIETLLGSEEFSGLMWTSLQPNVFMNFYLATAAGFIKEYRKTGKQGELRLMVDKETPVGVVDADEVGVIAARLLAQEDPKVHNGARYVLNGPVDITGEEIVGLVEKYIGTKVENVSYKDLSFVEDMAAASKDSKSLILSIRSAPVTMWEGKCTASTTSKEILEIAAPVRTPAEFFKDMLEE